MVMGGYIVRRLLIAIPVLFIVTVIVFLLVELAPGDPITAMLVGEDMLYVQGSLDRDAFVEAQKERLGLNAPPWVRYGRWLGGVLRGQLGHSILWEESVSSLIMERIPRTLLLMGIALTLSTIVGVLIGFVSAVRRYSWLDHFATLLSFGGISIPNFFLALILIYVFALTLKWLPTSGMYTIGRPESFADLLTHAVLPSLVLGWDTTANLVRYTRAGVLQVLREDYVQTARAKGLSEWSVLGRHVFRNALLPVVTILGVRLPSIIGGSVIVETVFAWPGLGKLAVDAVYNKDYPIIMGFNLMMAVAVLGANLMTDVVYAFVDPRIRYD